MNQRYLLFLFLLAFLLGCQVQNESAFAIREAFDVSNIETTFLITDELLPNKEIIKSPKPFTFPKGKMLVLPDSFAHPQMTLHTEKFIDSSYTQGMVVIQNDSLIYEAYFRGQTAATPRIIWSVTKSYVSALMGIALAEGHIKSI